MNDFIGTIKLFAGNYAPVGWLICDGSFLSTSVYSDLYNVIGFTYGNSGGNFALPDLRGRVPLGPNGAIPLGQSAGEQGVTLTKDQSGHPHDMRTSSQLASKSVPSGGGSSIAKPNLGSTSFLLYATNATPDVPLNGVTTDMKGGGIPHNNMQPYLGLNYIICYETGA